MNKDYNIEMEKEGEDLALCKVVFNDEDKLEQYFIFDKNTQAAIKDNNGKVVYIYPSLAFSIFDQCEKRGYEKEDNSLIINWYIMYYEEIYELELPELKKLLLSELSNEHDFSFKTSDFYFNTLFSTKEKRIFEIEKWIINCSHLQCIATYCFNRIYHSISIAYVLAYMIEKYDRKDLNDHIEDIADILNDEDNSMNMRTFIKQFNNFKTFYDVRRLKSGNIIVLDKKEKDSIINSIVDADVLLGRNFVHIKDGDVVETNNHNLCKIAGFVEYDEDEEYDEDDEDEEYDEDYDCENEGGEEDNNNVIELDEDYVDLLPDECWVKRFSISKNEMNGENYYHLVLNVKDNKIVESYVILESVAQFGGGLFIPGYKGRSEYDVVDGEYNEVISQEIEMIMKKRYLQNNFTFFDKPLPKHILRFETISGESYILNIDSAYRLAYITVIINVTDNDLINEFEYRTYDSTGSSYWDMFSRPHSSNDMKEEAFDCALYLLDSYSDDEYNEIVNKK